MMNLTSSVAYCGLQGNNIPNCEASPPFRAGLPGKEKGHFCIAPLDPALKDGRSALRQHFVRGEHAGQSIM